MEAIRMNVMMKIALSALLVGCMPIKNSGTADKSTLKFFSSGDVSVLFHPVDPSLQIIAKELQSARQNIDIAMYSMDVTPESPVMQTLSSADMQSRIRSGALRIRVIFEGYGSDEDNKTRSEALEKLGVDVRWFSSNRKVHHKFAAIDAGSADAAVITGSANWSLGSMKNYDEAILVLRAYPGVTMAYQKEFNLLWGLSDEFGATRFPETHPTANIAMESGVKPLFNSANFAISGKRISVIEPKLWTLTRSLVAAIDASKSSIKIATTRIVLRPVYNALLRAAARGVKIDILVNQDEYEVPNIRKKAVLSDCANEYDEKCSTSTDFPWFLDSVQYPGKENVKVRIKFFSLNTQITLAKQMHAKYIIIDEERVQSGSFNWSTSAEYNHIENVVNLENSNFGSVISAFEDNHRRVFNQGRDQYEGYISRIENAIKTGVKTDCGFYPMALTFSEIDYLLDSGQRAGNKPFREACN
jgi:phosphatidylserine/phosphatidylglycerophosphate/cardiolipin synthase-like enzyme